MINIGTVTVDLTMTYGMLCGGGTVRVVCICNAY